MSSRRACRPALLLLLALGACADLERGPRPEAPADGGAGDGGAGDGEAADGSGAAVSFARDVHPLLVDGCRRCHGPGGSAASTAYVMTGDAAQDHARSVAFVNGTDPGASRLLGKTAGVGHAGGTIFAPGTPEHQTISRWISSGAMP
jgi:hypothetical protein